MKRALGEDHARFLPIPFVHGRVDLTKDLRRRFPGKRRQPSGTSLETDDVPSVLQVDRPRPEAGTAGRRLHSQVHIEEVRPLLLLRVHPVR